MNPDAPVTRTRLPFPIATISFVQASLDSTSGRGKGRNSRPKASVIYTLVEEVDSQSGGGGGITAENGPIPRLIHSEAPPSHVRHMCRRSSLKAWALFWTRQEELLIEERRLCRPENERV
jgi:hypothetical protein